jgi:hypothetical protein
MWEVLQQKTWQHILQLSMMNLHSNPMKLKIATKTMQIVPGKYTPIFTLGIKHDFCNKIYKQNDRQENWIINYWVHSKLLRK